MISARVLLRCRTIHRCLPLRNVRISIAKHCYATDKSAEDFRKLSDDEWRRKLTPLEYEVCRNGGTEPAFSGEYNAMYASGIFNCICCGSKLFSSETKFNSGSGWPSFYAPLSNALEERKDLSHGMVRVEVLCSKCEAHLGHVFDDGPPPTGKRYCINSVCLDFVPNKSNTN